MTHPEYATPSLRNRHGLDTAPPSPHVTVRALLPMITASSVLRTPHQRGTAVGQPFDPNQQQPVPYQQPMPPYPQQHQPYPHYPQHQPYPLHHGYNPYPPQPQSRGFAIASLVLGIVAGLVPLANPAPALVLAGLAITFGGIGIHRKQGGMAIAGLVLGVVAVAFVFALIVAVNYY